MSANILPYSDANWGGVDKYKLSNALHIYSEIRGLYSVGGAAAGATNGDRHRYQVYINNEDMTIGIDDTTSLETAYATYAYRSVSAINAETKIQGHRFIGDLWAKNGFAAEEASFFKDAITVDGLTTLGATNSMTVSASGVVDINGATDITGNLTVDGGVSSFGTTNAMTISDAGVVDINNDLTVDGVSAAITIGNNTVAEGTVMTVKQYSSLIIESGATFTNNGTATYVDLDVTGDMTLGTAGSSLLLGDGSNATSINVQSGSTFTVDSGAFFVMDGTFTFEGDLNGTTVIDYTSNVGTAQTRAADGLNDSINLSELVNLVFDLQDLLNELTNPVADP